MEANAQSTMEDRHAETLLEIAVKRQITRLTEAEQRRKVKGREVFRPRQGPVLSKA